MFSQPAKRSRSSRPRACASLNPASCYTELLPIRHGANGSVKTAALPNTCFKRQSNCLTLLDTGVLCTLLMWTDWVFCSSSPSPVISKTKCRGRAFASRRHAQKGHVNAAKGVSPCATGILPGAPISECLPSALSSGS